MQQLYQRSSKIDNNIIQGQSSMIGHIYIPLFEPQVDKSPLLT